MSSFLNLSLSMSSSVKYLTHDPPSPSLEGQATQLVMKIKYLFLEWALSLCLRSPGGETFLLLYNVKKEAKKLDEKHQTHGKFN